MEKFTAIGDLLLTLQRFMGKTQLEMSEWLDIDAKQYRGWIKHKSKVSDDSLKYIANQTKISYEILVRLNYACEVFYDIKSHRYSICPFDKSFTNEHVLKNQLFDTNERRKILPIKKETKENQDIGNYFPLYIKYKKLNKDVLEFVFNAWPDLNLVIKDQFGLYCGHLMVIPVSLETYLKIKEENEYSLQTGDILTQIPQEPIALHIYSLFTTCSTYAYSIIKRFVEFVLMNTPHKLNMDSVISRYTITKDGKELCEQFGMKKIFKDFDHFHSDGNSAGYEIVPCFFEARIRDMEWIEKYRSKV